MSENIYAAPGSNLELNSGKIKRPILVWIIFIMACMGPLGLVFHFAMVQEAFSIDKTMAKYYSSLGVADHVLIVLNACYSFYAALLLFKLKKSAVKFYLGFILLNPAVTLYSLSNKNYMEFILVNNDNIYVALLPNFIITILMVGYVLYLNRKGTLKE